MARVHITLKALGHRAIQRTVQLEWNEDINLATLDKHLPPLEDRHRRVITALARMVHTVEFTMVQRYFCIKIEANPQEWVEFCDPERKESENLFFNAVFNKQQGEDK